MSSKKTVVAGVLVECVHVAGVTNFLHLAESAGWRTVFPGPSVPVEEFLKAAEQENVDLIGVSYRLTAETGERLLGEFTEAASELHERGVRFAFGGTPSVVERVRQMGFFERVFDGSEPPEMVLAYLKGQLAEASKERAGGGGKRAVVCNCSHHRTRRGRPAQQPGGSHSGGDLRSHGRAAVGQ